MLVMKDKKVGPARLKIASSPSYALAELTTLCQEYALEMENSEEGRQDINLRLTMSSLIAWLAKRERGKEGRDDT